LPFEVLPCDDGGYLIDEYQISYLSTSRDLLRLMSPPANQPAPALVVADPDFDLSLDRIPEVVYQEETYAGPADRRSYDFNRYYSSFDRLPATKEEALCLHFLVDPSQAEKSSYRESGSMPDWNCP